MAAIDRASIGIQMMPQIPQFLTAQWNITIGSMEALSQSAGSAAASFWATALDELLSCDLGFDYHETISNHRGSQG